MSPKEHNKMVVEYLRLSALVPLDPLSSDEIYEAKVQITEVLGYEPESLNDLLPLH